MSSNKQLVIIGAGDYARELVDFLYGCNIDVLGFIDKEQPNKLIYRSLKILGNEDDYLANYKSYPFIMGVGNVKLRKQIVEYLELRGAKPSGPIISQETYKYIGTENFIGDGTVIHQGSIITNRVFIGKHCLINLGVTLGHDVRIGDYCNLSPGVHLNGHTTIGTLVTMGSGSVTIPKTNIGDEVILGAGAVVTKNIPNNCTAVGVPAKVLKQND